MRSKFFILTLMMMFCSLSFGQNNASTWGGDFNHHDYATNMQLVAKITVNHEVTDPLDLQIAAFCDDKRRSFVVNPTKTPVGTNYLVNLQIYGDKVHGDDGFGDDGNIIIKVYDGQSEYVLYTLQYNANAVIGDLSDPDAMPNMVFNYVAKIGTTNYATLQAAIDAATENQNVTLIDDITLTSDLNNPAKGYFNVNADDKVIIDLNGKKITATENSSGNFILFYNYGELTFNDSKNSAIVELTATIDRDWNAQSSIVLNRGGKLTINGGKFIHKGGSDMAITICNSANSYGDAYMYVKGGEIISEKYIAIRMRMADPSQNGDPGNGVSNLEVTGGTISGYSRAIWGQITNPSSEQLGNLTITGGIIKGTNPDNKKAIEMDNDTHDNIDVEISGDAYIDGKLIGDYSDYAVSGGTFTVPVEEGFCAEGYIPVSNPDGTYGVVVDPAYGKVAKIGGTYYETLQEALKAITSGCTLDILTDITITENWDCRYTGAKIGVPVTINGNDKTIKFTGEISDGYNHLAAFRFEAPVTVNNLVVDMSEAVAVFQNRFSAISTKANLTVNESKFIGSTTYANSRAIIFGEGGHEDLEIVVNETEFINWKYGVVDNMNGGDVNSVTITGNKFVNANVQISALESITFTGNTTNSDVQITSYTANNTLDVTAKNNNLATDGTYTVKAGGTLDLQKEFLTPVADVNGKIYFTLQDALNYAVTAADVVTVTLLDDINLEGKTWTPVYFNSYIAEGTNTLIIDGNNKTISNLTDMLFSGTWTGKKFEVKNLTISEAEIKHDVNDAAGNKGVGAVVGNISATEEIEFNNVKLVESHVEGGHWTGGLIGYAAGYSGNDGPVFTNIVIKNCQIIESTIVGKGSVGGVVGHATGDAWTSFGVEATTISNNTITSNGSSNNRAGIVMGTIGAAGTEQTTNNISLTGGVFVSVTESGNTATSNGTAITRIYGRQGSSTGILTLTKGGSYQNNPIEENVTYAVVAPGFKLEQKNGTYSVDVDPAYGKVAKIGDTYYETVDAAFAAAQDSDNVEIFVAGTYALSTSGKNITITGAVDGVVFDNIGAKNMDGANVTFNNVTFDYYPNVNYTGLQHSGNLVYNNCTINGQVFLYGTSETFNECTFNQNSADAYNVWTYGAKDVDFIVCTFNSVGKSVLIYSESESITNDVTVTDCDFIALAPVEGKAAIEMDSSLQGEIKLTIDDATTATGFGSGDVSRNSLWNNKKGNETEANNDITVVVDGVTVLAPLPLVAQIGDVKYTSLQAAIDAATSGQTTVIVISGVELENTLTVAAGKVVTLDLNGKTVSMNDNSAATAALLKNNGNLTIKDSSANGKLTFYSTTPSAANAYASNTISNHGTITILGGTIENTTVGGACYALDNYAGSTANIVGGKLTAEKTTVRIFNWTNGVASKATLNVSGGEIYSKDGYGININSGNEPYVDLKISGGEITTDDADYDLAVYVVNKNDAENFNVNITGGTFNGDVAINGTATQTMKPGAVKVSGGTFNGNYGVFSYAEDAVAVPVISITGGIFSSNYAEIYSYDDGFKFVFNNTTQMYGLQEFSDLEIFNLNELIAFRNAVNAGNSFAGKVVTVKADINMSSETNWIPIGTSENPFKGIFDGGNKTISYLKVNAPETSYVGLFGNASDATIKNITIDNATVTGKTSVGAIAGNLFRGNMDNCHVKGVVQIDGNYKVGGLIGGAYSNVRNSSLIADDDSYVKGTYVEANLEGDNVGGITGYNGEGTYTYSNNTVKNVTISGTRKVGGILGFIFEDAKVEGSVVENVTIESTSTIEYANANVGKMSIGGIIGQYQKHGKSDGYVNSSFVKNVTFVKDANLYFQVGPLVGGTRGNENFVPSETVTSEGNLVYMSTIQGKTTNTFLMNAVAKIGETEYYTLFDAVKAAQGETTTITLISNTSEEFAIDNTATAITLELNSKELTGAILPSDAKLTVKNGTINNNNSNVSAIEINAGTLNLEGVNIASARHAVRIDGAVIAEVNGGEYTLIPSNGVTQHAFNISGNANVTINGGKFVGPAGTASDSGSAVNVKSGTTVTINDGDFSGGKNYTLSAAGTLIVKGGTYDQDPSAYVAPGYKAEKTGNVWTVKLMTTEIFLTAAGTVTTADATDAVYSLMFTITDEVNKEVSVKIGSKKPANNSNAVLVIPETVEFDGINEAFEVTAIEDNAFNSCRNFVGDLTLPRYVRTIGDRSFNTCHYITNPEHPKGKLTLNEGLTSIGSQAFTNSYFTDGLSIPSSVTMIEPNAFQYARINGALTINSDVECALAFNSSEFTKVEIAEGVQKICANAFNGMVNVTEVVLPSTLTEIGLAAFNSDNAIETIWSNAETAPTIIWQSNIESNKHPFTQTVRDNAVVLVTTNYKNYTEVEKWKEFANIYGLYPIQKTGYSLLVKVNDNVCSVEIGDKPHQNDRIELELPRTIEYYGTERAVTSIAKGGFKSCPFFGTLTIPGNIETIADNAFNTCMQFNKLVIEEGVETIGNGSFNMCSNLKYISFPSTLESIGQNAFNVVYMGNGGRIVSFAANPPTAYKHIYNQGINPVNPSFPQNLRNNAILYVFEESLDEYKSATGWEFRDVRPIEAMIGETYYLTLNEAITAATSGQTITLLADVEAADGNPVLIPEGVTLDINTHDVTANINGTVKTSGGLWTTVTVPGFNSRKMLGNGAIYNTTDATVANSANEVRMLAGSIVLNPNPETEWWTLPNQNLSIASGASFEVPANIKFTVRENTHVVVNGTLTVNGVVYLQMGATVEAAEGLNILTDVEGYMVSYENGVYSVVQAIYTQTTQLGKGWNWFSYYVETDLAELENALGTNGLEIKSSKDGYVRYSSIVHNDQTYYYWKGGLSSISETQMYMINTSAIHTLEVSGNIVDSDQDIVINGGWTWIGYPTDKNVAINDALANLTPQLGDRIKTQDNGYAEYIHNETYNVSYWSGSLATLIPGEGYKYYSKLPLGSTASFKYIIPSDNSKSELRANVTTDNNHWIPSAGQYANNMTMTAMVNVEGNYEIAAFVNGEVRGSARPIYVEALDSYIYFLTIHGDEVEEMSFRLYDLDTDIEYNLSDRMNYSNDAIVGSLTEPYMFNLEMLGIGENSAESFNIYPNPTTTNAEINLNATCDMVEVFNALGVKIAEYSNVDSIDAVETAGIYVIRVTNNNNVQHCRLIVK